MNINDLSPEDQNLLNTEFPAELEKQAADEVQMANELYALGFEKMAEAAAEEVEKEEEEEKKKPENKLSEEHKKEAAVRGAFIAQGFIDGLMEKGASVHGDPLHYLYPAIEEVLVKEGAPKKEALSFLQSISKKMKGAGKSVSEGATKAKNYVADKAGKAKDAVVENAGKAKDSVVNYHKGIGKNFEEAWKSKDWKKKFTEGGKGLAKITPHIAAVGYAGKKALEKKD